MNTDGHGFGNPSARRKLGSGSSPLSPVVQEDRTGCAIASVAALTQQRYAAVKRVAEQLDIDVAHSKLWTDARWMRRLLTHFKVVPGQQQNFSTWDALPDRALLAIKWHIEKTGPAWHWVVFVRDASGSYVLDPKKALRTNRRTDFGRMRPKWFIGLSGSDQQRPT